MPIDCGRFAVVGDWDDSPTAAAKLRIVMPPPGPGVFGVWQPATKAAMSVLSHHVRKGCSFLDIGTGCGILAVAAKLLGADRVVATEINPEALIAARNTFAANGVAVKLVNGTFVPDEQFDVAVVSISSEFARANLHQINAKVVLIVEDDYTVTEVVSGD